MAYSLRVNSERRKWLVIQSSLMVATPIRHELRAELTRSLRLEVDYMDRSDHQGVDVFGALVPEVAHFPKADAC